MKIKLKLLIAVFALSATTVVAQTGKLDLRFNHLEERAEEVVDVTLDGQMLRLAIQFLSNQAEDQRRIKEAISGVTGIYVRSFKFDERDGYSIADVEKVRSQLDRNWQRIVTVRSKRKENVDVMVRPGERGTRGLVIIAAEPHEFTVVQIVGDIDIEKLGHLQGQFGIPELDKDSLHGRSDE